MDLKKMLKKSKPPIEEIDLPKIVRLSALLIKLIKVREEDDNLIDYDKREIEVYDQIMGELKTLNTRTSEYLEDYLSGRTKVIDVVFENQALMDWIMTEGHSLGEALAHVTHQRIMKILSERKEYEDANKNNQTDTSVSDS